MVIRGIQAMVPSLSGWYETPRTTGIHYRGWDRRSSCVADRPPQSVGGGCGRWQEDGRPVLDRHLPFSAAQLIGDQDEPGRRSVACEARFGARQRLHLPGWQALVR